VKLEHEKTMGKGLHGERHMDKPKSNNSVESIRGKGKAET
jgi:hypothetical protein